MPTARSRNIGELYNLPMASGSARLSPSAFAMGAAGFAEVLGQATDVLGDRMEREARARRVVELAKTKNGAAAELNDLAVSLERDPDWQTVPDRFKKGADQIRAKYAGSMKDGLGRQEFELGFDRDFNPLNVGLKRKALENGEKDALATMDATIEAEARNVVGAPDRVTAQRARERAAKTIADLRDAGWIAPDRAGKEFARFNSRVDEARVRSMMTADPEGVQKALDDPQQFMALDPVQRATLADQAGRRVDTLVRQRIAQEERDDRLARRRLEDARSAASKDLWDRWASNSGRLDLAEVQQQKARLSETDYRALVTAALGGDGGVDEPGAVRELKQTVDSEQPAAFEARAYSLLKSGRIRLETYRAEVDRNRSYSKEDSPASPFRSGREYVKAALDPGQLGGDATLRQPLAIAQQRALADFDSWAEQNAGAPRAVTIKRAEELTAQYQAVGYSEMRLSLPRPHGFTGAKQNVAQSDIDAARLAIARDLSGGRLDRDSAARAATMLELWEQVLDKAAGAK
jgi:hypothetical protein